MNNIFNRKFDLSRDLDGLQKRISQVAQLRELTNVTAWKFIRLQFEQEIAALVQSYIDLCDNPSKNEIEIRCKKMVSESLGRILSTIESTANSGDRLSAELKQRTEAVPKPTRMF